MNFRATIIPGAYVIEPEMRIDERGYFTRLWCEAEFSKRGLSSGFTQSSLAYNAEKGTLRGMHYQKDPHAEAKLVFCTAGSLYDVVLDLRPDSPAFRQWVAVELSRQNKLLFYIPEGCAHGYQTLENETEAVYQMSVPYAPESAAGVRWNDPAFDIVWPAPQERIISEKDEAWPDFEDRLVFRRMT